MVTIDFTEWVQFAQNMKDVVAQYPELEARTLERIGERFVFEITQQASVPQGKTFAPIDTRTYVDALDSIVLPGNAPGESRLFFGHLNPSGIGAERLPIYWRVLERGSPPIANVPRQALIAWSLRRFGNAGIGMAVARRIREVGIEPQPILQHFFIFDSSFSEVIGATPRTNTIIEEELSEMLRGLQRIIFRKGARAGQAQVIRRDPLGRFAKQ